MHHAGRKGPVEQLPVTCTDAMQNYIPAALPVSVAVARAGLAVHRRVNGWVKCVRRIVTGLRGEIKMGVLDLSAENPSLHVQAWLQEMYLRGLSWSHADEDDRVFSLLNSSDGDRGEINYVVDYSHVEPFGHDVGRDLVDDLSAEGYQAMQVKLWFVDVTRRREKRQGRPTLPHPLRAFCQPYATRWFRQGHISKNTRRMFPREPLSPGPEATESEAAVEAWWFEDGVDRKKYQEALVSEMAPGLPGYRGSKPNFLFLGKTRKGLDLREAWALEEEEAAEAEVRRVQRKGKSNLTRNSEVAASVAEHQRRALLKRARIPALDRYVEKQRLVAKANLLAARVALASYQLPRGTVCEVASEDESGRSAMAVLRAAEGERARVRERRREAILAHVTGVLEGAEFRPDGAAAADAAAQCQEGARALQEAFCTSMGLEVYTASLDKNRRQNDLLMGLKDIVQQTARSLRDEIGYAATAAGKAAAAAEKSEAAVSAASTAIVIVSPEDFANAAAQFLAVDNDVGRGKGEETVSCEFLNLPVVSSTSQEEGGPSVGHAYRLSSDLEFPYVNNENHLSPIRTGEVRNGAAGDQEFDWYRQVTVDQVAAAADYMEHGDWSAVIDWEAPSASQ